MLSHWALDAYASSDISQKRATGRAQNSSHSPAYKDGSTQRAINKIIYIVFFFFFCFLETERERDIRILKEKT